MEEIEVFVLLSMLFQLACFVGESCSRLIEIDVI